MHYVLIITYLTLGWSTWEVKDIQKVEGFTSEKACVEAAHRLNSPNTIVQCMEVK